MGTLHVFIDKLIADGKGDNLQFKLKTDLNQMPLGPGKVERIVAMDPRDGSNAVAYKLFMPAIMQIGSKQSRMILPIVFAPEDILWFSEGPVDDEGQSSVIVPGGGSKSAGGLHIPGR